MKQFILKTTCVFFAFMMFGLQTFAYTTKAMSSITRSDIESVTAFDDAEIYNAFAEVSALDQYLAVNDGKTYAEVNNENSPILNGVSATSSLPLSASASDLALGIPSFWWGCAFGVVGMLIVYLITDSKEETKKALWGCAAWTVVSVVVYIVAFAAASTTTTY